MKILPQLDLKILELHYCSQRSQIGGVLAEFPFSHCIDCSSTDVFLPSPGKVRMCGAIHIDWWIKWAAERTRMIFVVCVLAPFVDIDCAWAWIHTWHQRVVFGF